MELKLGKYVYLIDDYGNTSILKDGQLYDRGSKSLRYLLEYIECLEDGRKYDELQDLRYYASSVVYKNRNIKDSIKNKTQ